MLKEYDRVCLGNKVVCVVEKSTYTHEIAFGLLGLWDGLIQSSNKALSATSRSGIAFKA